MVNDGSQQQEPMVYIVDDEEQVLDVVYSMLDAEGIQAKKFTSGQDFLDQEEISEFGCLLLDNQMPGLSGLEVQAELLKRNNNIPIVFISGTSRYDDVVVAVNEGALFFLQKPFSHADLISNVEKAIVESRQRLEKSDHESTNRTLMNTLTAREKQVCQLVADGLTNKLIAEKLSISNGTVEFHRANLTRKLGVKSLADLMEINRSVKAKG